LKLPSLVQNEEILKIEARSKIDPLSQQQVIFKYTRRLGN
jgi:hypothetical protein